MKGYGLKNRRILLALFFSRKKNAAEYADYQLNLPFRGWKKYYKVVKVEMKEVTPEKGTNV